MRLTETIIRSDSNPKLITQLKLGILKQAKHLIIPIVICCTCPVHAIAQYPTAEAYIAHFTPLVKKLSDDTGIPASVIMGIAIIESGHGNSKNCILLKNHFGIVGKNNLAKTHPAYHSMYKSYTSDEASFRHFCKVIQSKKYYAALKGNPDYKTWLLKINAGNYSSAKLVWVHRISIAINSHQLYKLDVKREYIAWK